MIRIYSDGGASPNDGAGIGSWAYVIIHPNNRIDQNYGSVPQATNNQMEILSAIHALDEVPPHSDILFFTDSDYLRRGITDWVHKWMNPAKGKKPWTTSKGKPVKNTHLWQQLLTSTKRHRSIEWQWVKSHNGDEWNEKVDGLVKDARLIVKNRTAVDGKSSPEALAKNEEGEGVEDLDRDLTPDEILDLMFGNDSSPDRAIAAEEKASLKEKSTEADEMIHIASVEKDVDLWKQINRSRDSVTTGINLRDIRDGFASHHESEPRCELRQFNVYSDYIIASVTVHMSDWSKIEDVCNSICKTLLSYFDDNCGVSIDNVSTHVDPEWVNIGVKIKPHV